MALRISCINSRQSVQCTTIPYIASFAAIMIFTVQSISFVPGNIISNVYLQNNKNRSEALQ